MRLDWREVVSRGAMIVLALCCVLIGLRFARAANAIVEDADEMAGLLSLAALALLGTGLWLGISAFRPKWKG